MRSFLRARRRVLAMALVALLLVGVGAIAAVTVGGSGPASASARDKPGPIGPIAFVPTASSPPPIAARSAVARVVAALNGTSVVASQKGRRLAIADKHSDLVSARIGAAAPVGYPVPKQAAFPALYVTVKSPGPKNGGDVEPLWEASLLQGAVAELAGTSNSLIRDVGYEDVREQLPSGRLIDAGGGMGNIARGQQFAGANESDAAITSSVERVASTYGLSVDSVTVFRAWGAAPAVVLTAPDVSTAAHVSAKWQALQDALFGSGPRYEAYYLEIRYANGTPFVRRSLSFLTGAGQLWTGKQPSR